MVKKFAIIVGGVMLLAAMGAPVQAGRANHEGGQKAGGNSGGGGKAGCSKGADNGSSREQKGPEDRGQQ
jgi:hypothetical protein